MSRAKSTIKAKSMRRIRTRRSESNPEERYESWFNSVDPVTANKITDAELDTLNSFGIATKDIILNDVGEFDFYQMSKEIDLSELARRFDEKAFLDIQKVAPKEKSATTSKRGDAYHSGWTNGTGYLARVLFNSADRILVRLMVAKFDGGTYTLRRPKDSKCRPGHTFMAYSKNAEVVLKQLLPYLVKTKELAEMILELRDLQQDNRGKGKTEAYQAYLEKAEALHNRLRALKATEKVTE